MNQIWQRIEDWLSTHAPSVAAELNPPASEEQIRSTEQHLGVAFPADVRASYLRHDGQTSNYGGLMSGWKWLSLQRIRDEWKVWKDLLDGGDFDGIQSDGDGAFVRRDWWNPRWIPLTYSGSGDHHCLDLDPGPKGTHGQMIEMWHDEGSRPLLAPSFRAWLEDFADDLEADEYVMSDEYGGLCRREDI